jgi:hypothetical protein
MLLLAALQQVVGKKNQIFPAQKFQKTVKICCRRVAGFGFCKEETLSTIVLPLWTT